MRKWMFFCGTFLLTIATVTGIALAADDSEVIKNVMKVAMKGGLLKSVASGNADAKQKQDLLVLFKDLSNAKPPKGSEKDWKKKTDALVDAAQHEVEGKAGAGAQLKKAANCKACHDAHKGK